MCGEQYSDEEDEADDDNKHRSVCTDHEVLNPDRRTAPRGTTPLLDAPRSAASVPRIYLNGRVAEYDKLRSRGATYHMCTTFRLSFDKATGIIAHLEDGDLLWEEFAGPAMAEGDVWKVCLGRRIVLEEEDIDGSTFVEELLEQVLHFPMCREGDEGARDEWRWETVKEEDGWITRPVVGAVGAVEAKDADSDASSDSAPSDSEGLDPGQRYDMMLENSPKGSGDDEPVRRDEYEPTDYDSDEENDEDVEMADGGSSESDDAENKAEVDDVVDFAQPDYAWGESEESDSDAEESEEESEEPSDFFDTSDEEAEATGSATTGTCA
ncbi:hypothetical protein BOTBODRAFT_35046 [Botryobasidium botryosum FD-172 SS1]|uniref:DUF8191 domain-containing protein n=1 Tax=Botryobasidium botryosum (strain FD-172 SS1) TaxID=930990 RepID=A0A067MAT0_BOTB1|nr:hypothetical protein BOTBODRAFT_35046 [Botryobasidium botryosum FD-172 SS1]